MFAQEESNDLQEHNQEGFFFLFLQLHAHTHMHSLIVVAINWKMVILSAAVKHIKTLDFCMYSFMCDPTDVKH